jgi:hypothetical protein
VLFPANRRPLSAADALPDFLFTQLGFSEAAERVVTEALDRRP